MCIRARMRTSETQKKRGKTSTRSTVFGVFVSSSSWVLILATRAALFLTDFGGRGSVSGRARCGNNYRE